jgi:hypothetical protein
MAAKADTELGSSQIPSLDIVRPHHRTSCEQWSILAAPNLTPREAYLLRKVSCTRSKPSTSLQCSRRSSSQLSSLSARPWNMIRTAA